MSHALNCFLLTFSLFVFSESMSQDTHPTILCLGDSYTIGESVEERERFPEQTVELLKEQGIVLDKPLTIAHTGWTTDELSAAIADSNLKGKFDFVTLLIGVNNQYRGRDLVNYRLEFAALLRTAIQYAGGKPNQVIVLSIPDWGATPFIAQDGKKRTRDQVTREIDSFNAVNKEEAEHARVHYIDITPISRQALQKEELTASDGLHPSAKMYAAWAKLLAAKIKSLIRS